MKSIVFVINTMGIGGAESAVLELLRKIDPDAYEVSLLVLTSQGELISRIPETVHLLNRKTYPVSVHDRAGKLRLFKTVMSALFIRGMIFRRMGYIVSNLLDMLKKKQVQMDKLLWKALSDSLPGLSKKYDLAVACLEGGAAYYTSANIKAERKAAFIHTNYTLAGYNRKLDEDCYLDFDRIFTVSDSVKDTFLSVYPECTGRTAVFHNLINRENILSKAKEEGGFTDDYCGFRILTVGRLVPLKAIDTAVEAMRILKGTGKAFRWYVLGNGELRKQLETMICRYGLEQDFFLLGTVENPFPYYDQCDLYVHTARFEGRSVAIDEAQHLGCAVLASDFPGVEEQVQDGIDGKVCGRKPEDLADAILEFAGHPEVLRACGCAAAKKAGPNHQKEMDKLMALLIDKGRDNI